MLGYGLGLLGLLFIGLIVVVAGWVILTYNGLVTLRNQLENAWSQIDVQLKRRYDLIPNLVEAVKDYMEYEQDVLTKVTEARAQAVSAQGPAQQAQADNMLTRALRSLFAVVENYPELKANETFQHLQGRITGLENGIADRREFYNESVNLNNIGIEEFPDVVVARLFNFKALTLLEFEQSELADVDVGALFQS